MLYDEDERNGDFKLIGFFCKNNKKYVYYNKGYYGY